MHDTYEVKDPKTGKTVTFDWHDAAPPTETDLDEIFKSAHGFVPDSASAPHPARTGSSGSWEPQSLTEALATGIGNIPSSAASTAKHFWDAISHPVNTAEGVGRTILGAEGNLARKLTGDATPQGPNEKVAGAVWDDMAKRYGGWENIKSSISNDPVGTTLDASTLFAGAGGVMEGAGAAGKISTLEAAGKVLGNAGKMIDPTRIAALPIKAVGKVAGAVLDPMRLYGSALKPSTALSAADRAKLVLHGVHSGIVIDAAGAEYMDKFIPATMATVDAKIAEAAQKGIEVSTNEILKPLDELQTKFGETGNVAADDARIKMLDDTRNDFAKKYGTSIPVEKAQELKQNMYAVLTAAKKNAYNGLTTIGSEIDKGLGRGYKQAIEQVIPEIKEINGNAGDMIEFKKVFDRALNRIENREMIGLPELAAGAAGGAKLAIVKRLLDQPAIKSRLAIMLHNAGKLGQYAPPADALTVSGLTNAAGRLVTGQ